MHQSSKNAPKMLLVNDLSEAQRRLKAKSAFQRMKSTLAGTSGTRSKQ
jgi:hypothetical protein